MIGDVSYSAAQNLPIFEQHLGGFGLDLPGRQDEIDAMRRLPGGEVLGPERRRAASVERVVQSAACDELAEQGTVSVDVEVPAHHSRDRDIAHDTGHGSELGTVNRAEPVRRRPIAVSVGHRMGVNDRYRRVGQPGHQRTLHPRPEPDQWSNAWRASGWAESVVGRRGHREP